eukprot:1394575-Amorphochlora_amoeboformis.AAC.1
MDRARTLLRSIFYFYRKLYGCCLGAKLQRSKREVNRYHCFASEIFLPPTWALQAAAHGRQEEFEEQPDESTCEYTRGE